MASWMPGHVSGQSVALRQQFLFDGVLTAL